jgi:uncharacterized protein
LADSFKGKVIILLGARQVGKSTLIRNLFNDTDLDVLWLDGENTDVQQIFADYNSQKLGFLAGKSKVIVIDEAQKINQIGSILKLYADYHSNLQIVASGSSSFTLKNELNEPLTGRKYEYHLYPLSSSELVRHTSIIEERRNLPIRLIYGQYPDIVNQPLDAERLLKFLSDSYLYKDVFQHRGIKKPDKILELLKSLAWQVGSEVNYNELSSMLKIDNQTVESYIHLLEQAYVIYRLPSYHNNHRVELKKSKKIYFNDLGIRNALINDFRPIEVRNDAGHLFENFVINELRKENDYGKYFANFYFWRNIDQREVDLVISKNNTLSCIEIKWNPTHRTVLTKSFTNIYPNTTFQVIDRDNYLNSILNYSSMLKD